ncbi:hypothetical protein LVY72_20370 [Arthrobacter sp. I2-34]|uniref:Secreted protein n=1 Tax=Arthrobacter hankyongi TaxID=2904801 RepID=A0ABS9LC45_9MICC|nr:hypothetical protein [Arthrobacter hankyongi]MCG2624249.1 hypothetical protein [Arthrobacter hankyongi]
MNLPVFGRRPARLQLAAAAVLWLAACGQPAGSGLACTEIAALRGLSLTVAADTAAAVRGVRLEVCQQGSCTAADPELVPGSTTSGGDCPPASGGSADPDQACSATARPDGTLTGFAALPALAAGAVEVRAVVIGRDGSRRRLEPLAAEARLVYPNGPQCPGAEPQLALVLDTAGLHPLAPESGR